MTRAATRTQRRLEKKQALGLLALGLMIALISFGLGVLVGRGGSCPVAEEEVVAPERIAIAVPEEGSAVKEEIVAEATAEQLTFYDALPEGKQPLGSGVNLAPQVESAKVEVRVAPSSAVEDRVELADKEPTPAPAKKVVPNLVKVVVQPRAADGGYVVQVASVTKKAGADGLRERLASKGYGVFVEQADLGARGIWYRVYAGPYPSRREADQAVKSLKDRGLAASPLVRRR
jgi:cell division septation protein DedD